MFLIGETSCIISGGRIQLPKAYHLKKKDLLCKWKNERTLLLSDNEGALKLASGISEPVEAIHVDSESRIFIGPEFNTHKAVIKGNISVIEILLV